MEKKLSFIVPMFNMEKYISRCLDTLVNQDLHPDEYEILVIDDGSLDKSAAIVKNYQEQYRQIKYIYQINKGQAAARNAGISVAQGKYICFVDADDFVRKNIFGKLERLASQNALDLLSFQSVSGDDSIFPKESTNSCEVQEVYKGDEYITVYNYPNYCWLYLINLDFLRNSGIFFKEGIYLEDIVFTTQILLAAKRVAKIKAKVYYYFIRNDSTMHNKDKSHINRLLNDYYQVIILLSEILKNARQNIKRECWEIVNGRRNSLIFFMLVKMLKARVGKNKIKEYVTLLENHQLYPFAALPVTEYPGIKYKLIYKVITNKRLLLLISSIY